MKRFCFLFYIWVFSIVILTGCWNKYELNELAIVVAVGIDKSEEGYLVTVQLLNPSEITKEQPTTKPPVTTYRASGVTVFEAIKKLSMEVSRKVYFSHARLVVFGEDLAREEGIAKTLDFLTRDHVMRTDFYNVIAKDLRAEELLNVLTPLEEIPANKIYYSLETSEKVWAPAHHVQLDELINSLVSEGKEPVMTGVTVKENLEIGMDIQNVEKADVPANLQLSNLGVLKKDKLIGWLNKDENIGFSHIVGTVQSTLVNTPWPEGGVIGVELIRTKPHISGKVVNGVPKITIDHRVEGNIGDVEIEIDLIKDETIKKIEKLLEEEIEKNMYLSVEKAQDLKSDIFGFGEVIHRSNPKAWEKLKYNWDEEFEYLEVNIHVTAKIKRIGTTTESFMNTIVE